MPTPKYTAEQLQEKRKQGTLTQEDKVDYLVQVRGMLRGDAEHIAMPSTRTRCRSGSGVVRRRPEQPGRWAQAEFTGHSLPVMFQHGLPQKHCWRSLHVAGTAARHVAMASPGPACQDILGSTTIGAKHHPMRIAIATLIGTITYFLAGWLVFEGLLGRYMAAQTTALPGFRKEGDATSMLFLVLSCMAYALLIALVFERWAHVRTFSAGLLLGALIGAMVATMADLYWFSTTHFYRSLWPVLADVAAAALTVGILGGVIGWYLGLARGGAAA